MRGLKRFNFFHIGVLLLFFTSCIDQNDYDFDKIAAIEWDPSYAIKLIHGNLSIKDFDDDIEDFEIRSYDDGLLYFYYESYTESDAIGDLIEFPDVEYETGFASAINFSGSLNQELTVIDDTVVIDLNIGGGELDSVFYDRFDLNFIVGSTANMAYEVDFTLPTFFDNGVPITRTYVRQTSDPNVIQEQNMFTNFLADLTRDDPPHNRFPIVIKVKLLPANNVTITQGDIFGFRFEISNQDFSWVNGYFIPDSRVITDEDISVDIFEKNFEGDYTLQGTLMTFEIGNDFGVPIKLYFNKLDASNADGDVVPININPSSPFEINSPTVMGQTAYSTVQVTNAAEVFNIRPNRFTYNIEAFVNDGYASGRNFLTDTSKARVKFMAEMPLWGSASDIVLKDTVQIDFDELSQEGIDINAKAAYLKTRVINGYPVDVAIQGVLLDNNYMFLDTLLSRDQSVIVRSALTDDDGIVEEGVFDEEIELDEQKVDALFDATYMLIVARMRTYTDSNGTRPEVKFFDQASIDVDMGLRTDLNVVVNPD